MNLTVLHPYIDHFSIVLVIVGIILEYRAKLAVSPPTDTVGWGSIRVGLGFWLLSILSGYAAQAKTYLDPSVQQLLNYHQVTGLIAFGTLGAAILLRIVSRTKFHGDEGASLRGAYYAILTVALVLSIGSIFLGSKLVYSHGVGVKPYQELLESAPEVSTPVSPSTQPADTTHK
jgi:uncharacterized membrane protein